MHFIALILTLTSGAASWVSGPSERPLGPGAVTALWVEGGVSSVAAAEAPSQGAEIAPGQPVLVGTTISREHQIVLDPGAQLFLLAEGHRLLVLDGPAIVVAGARRLKVVEGTPPKELVADGFAEPASMPHFPSASLPPVSRPAADGATLVSPLNGKVRAEHPVIRWVDGPDGGPYDLLVERLYPDGAVEMVERWRGLVGREHRLVTRLARGGRFRIRLATTGVDGVFGLGPETVVFSVLSSADERALMGQLQALARAAREGVLSGAVLEVLTARLHEAYGVLEVAEDIWRRLAAAHPDRKELLYIARRLHAARL